ncbi:MAG TPA: hypothetical protein VHK91_10120 [Flavisolibacter sp.]|nr:hypothetical protein [Flavisolibacter sp.]
MALFAGALFLFDFMVHEVLWEKEEQVDNSIFSFLSTHVISDGLTGFMKLSLILLQLHFYKSPLAVYSYSTWF